MTQTNIPDPNVTPLPGEDVHRPADDKEEVYFDGSPLVRGTLAKAFWWVVIGLALIVAPYFVHTLLHPRISPWIYAAMVAIGVIVIAVPPLRALTIRFRVTNYRIDYERGWIGKDIDTLELWHVEDIRYHQTFLDRLLGLGDISVHSHDATTPLLLMRSLPNSRHLFEQLKQRIISVKRQRGVLKVDSGS